MIAYPTAAPMDAVTSMLSIVTSGNITANLGQFALDVWNVQGFLQSLALPVSAGKPSDPQPSIIFSASPPVKIVDRDDAAHAAIELQAHLSANDPRVAGALPIDWAILVPIVKWGLTQVIAAL